MRVESGGDGRGFDISANISLIELVVAVTTAAGGTGGGGLLGTILISGNDVVVADVAVETSLLNVKSKISTGTGARGVCTGAEAVDILIPPNKSVTVIVAGVVAGVVADSTVLIPPNKSVSLPCSTPVTLLEVVPVLGLAEPPDDLRFVIPTLLLLLTPPNKAAAIFSFSVNSLGFIGSLLAMGVETGVVVPLLKTLPIPNGEVVAAAAVVVVVVVAS